MGAVAVKVSGHRKVVESYVHGVSTLPMALAIASRDDGARASAGAAPDR
jgi:hypothetical protein